MHDAFGMSGVERVRNLNGQAEQNIGVHGFSGNAMLQCHAIEMLHGDEGFSILLANVEDHADVGVVQRGCGFCLAPLKTSECLRVASHIFGQEFEGDKTAEADIFRLVNHTHAAAAELCNDAVMRDGLTDHSRRVPFRWLILRKPFWPVNESLTRLRCITLGLSATLP